MKTNIAALIVRFENPAAPSNFSFFFVPKKEFACVVGVEVRGGAVTVPTEAAGFILSALESSGERATLRSRQCVDPCVRQQQTGARGGENCYARCMDV